MTNFSDRLKDAIKKAGISQRELEAKTGIPQSAIQRYASGSTDKIPMQRVKPLAEALGTSAEHLLGWEDKNNLNAREKELVELFQKLSKDQQNLIIASIKGILANNK